MKLIITDPDGDQVSVSTDSDEVFLVVSQGSIEATVRLDAELLSDLVFALGIAGSKAGF